jgi:hypothetical protein
MKHQSEPSPAPLVGGAGERLDAERGNTRRENETMMNQRDWPHTLVCFEWGNENWYGSSGEFDELMASDDAPDWTPDTGDYDLVEALSTEYAVYTDDIEPGNGRMISITNPRIPRWTLFIRAAECRDIATYRYNPIGDDDPSPDWTHWAYREEVATAHALMQPDPAA